MTVTGIDTPMAILEPTGRPLEADVEEAEADAIDGSVSSGCVVLLKVKYSFFTYM
jgi:hypothetical protein